MGVGADVRWGELEAGVVDEIVGQGCVDGSEAFEQITGAKGEAEPKAFCAGLGEEGAAGEAFRVGGVVEVVFAYIADVLYVIDGEGDDTT